jgi:hypothetical protein
VDRLRAEGRAAPGPPASTDLIGALFAMMWRIGLDVSIKEIDDPAELDHLAETLSFVVVRTLGLSTDV